MHTRHVWYDAKGISYLSFSRDNDGRKCSGRKDRETDNAANAGPPPSAVVRAARHWRRRKGIEEENCLKPRPTARFCRRYLAKKSQKCIDTKPIFIQFHLCHESLGRKACVRACELGSFRGVQKSVIESVVVRQCRRQTHVSSGAVRRHIISILRCPRHLSKRVRVTAERRGWMDGWMQGLTTSDERKRGKGHLPSHPTWQIMQGEEAKHGH